MWKSASKALQSSKQALTVVTTSRGSDTAIVVPYMPDAVSDDTDDEDYTLSDLTQENLVLRNELNEVYSQLSLAHEELKSRTSNRSDHASSTACQTDHALVFDLPAVKDITTELGHQKRLNMEHCRRAKDAEYSLHQLEMRMLDYNVQLLKAGSLNAKVEELTDIIDGLHIKLSYASHEHVNLTIELKHHLATIDSLQSQLKDGSCELKNLEQRYASLEGLLQDANKKLHAKEVELVETQQLNTEYQVKLHSDDMQFINYRSEINFWERKCESQSKELTKLNDAITALRSSNQALEEKLSKAKTDHLDCDNYKANISDEKMLRLTSDVLLCKGLSCDDSNTSPDDRTKTHTPGGSAPDKHLVTADRTMTMMMMMNKKKNNKKKMMMKQPRSGATIDYLVDDGFMDADDCSCFPSGAKK